MLRFSSYDILFGNYLLEIWNMYTFMDVWKYPFHWLLERYIFRPENHYPVCRTADGVCLWWLSDGLQTSGCEATIRPLPCDTSDDHWPLVTWSGCHQPAVRILIGYNHQTLVASDCKEQTCKGMVRATAGRQCHRFKSVCCSVADIAAGRNNCD